MAHGLKVKNGCLEGYKATKLFKNLTPDELQVFSECDTKVEYNKGDNIIKQGEFVTHILFVKTGLVKVQSVSMGKVFLVDIIPSGDFILFPLMLTSDYHQFSVLALSDASICFFNVNLVKKLYEQNGRFAIDIMKELSRMYFFMQDRLHHYIKNNIHGRVASMILYFYKHVFKSKQFDILLTRNELSQFTGISRENVIKVLTEFNNEGIVKIDNKRFEIINQAFLETIALKG